VRETTVSEANHLGAHHIKAALMHLIGFCTAGGARDSKPFAELGFFLKKTSLVHVHEEASFLLFSCSALILQRIAVPSIRFAKLADCVVAQVVVDCTEYLSWEARAKERGHEIWTEYCISLLSRVASKKQREVGFFS
jgi:hypothetical protein